MAFLFLAFDELLQIHEFIGQSMPADNGCWAAWMIPCLASLILIVCFTMRLLFRLPARTRNIFFLAGFLFLFCASGIDYTQTILKHT